ncbi:MAG: DUF1559 domain-containing protein [Phycisphaera sp.]|nr:DUF1559 domain-containing protein [Phycisphaera sp.]
MSPSSRNNRAFTIVELLVVVSILILLTVLAMPAYEKAQETGRRAICASNEHQIGFAALNYAADNATAFPSSTQYAGNWWWDMSRDVRGFMVDSGATRDVFYCPSGIYQNDESLWEYATDYIVTGYYSLIEQPNRGFPPLTGSNHTLVSLSKVSGAAVTPMSTDSNLSTNAMNFTYVKGGWAGVHRSPHLDDRKLLDDATRQPAGGNLLFVDGHVGWRTFDEMELRTQADHWPWHWW